MKCILAVYKVDSQIFLKEIEWGNFDKQTKGKQIDKSKILMRMEENLDK